MNMQSKRVSRTSCCRGIWSDSRREGGGMENMGGEMKKL
jgi:hypothetical protein